MPHGAGFYTLECVKCRNVFELPSLGDMTYGEALLHSERGDLHRYVCVLESPVWSAIDAVLRSRAPEGSDEWWRVLAALADAVDGQHFRIDPVCPHCQADGTHFRRPGWASKTPRIGEVKDAPFSAFLALPEDERAKRVAGVADERV